MPVIVLAATPFDAVALPVPLIVPAPDAFAKATTVELSAVTVLPAASWIVAVRTRVAPEARSAVEPERAICAAAPWTTVKAPSVPVVSPLAVASIVTDPVSTPVIVFVATPLEAVALPVRNRAGAGGLGEGDDGGAVGGDGVAGSVLDRRRRARFDPVRSAVEPVRAIWVAAPWTTVKAPSVPVVNPAADASIVTEPTSARERPRRHAARGRRRARAVTVPAPPCCANVTTVELSETTVLPFASFTVAVSARVAPEVRFAVEPESEIWVGGTVDEHVGLHRDRVADVVGAGEDVAVAADREVLGRRTDDRRGLPLHAPQPSFV